MESQSYNENSNDAMFSKLLSRLEAQDKMTKIHFQHVTEQLEVIATQTKLTNGRVTKLEQWRDAINTKVAVIASCISIAFSVLYLAIQWFLK